MGIDHIPELVEMSRANFKKDGRGEKLDAGKVLLVTGEARARADRARWRRSRRRSARDGQSFVVAHDDTARACVSARACRNRS